MKKNFMTDAAGRMVLTFFFFFCAMTTVVNAQTAEPESKMDKYLEGGRREPHQLASSTGSRPHVARQRERSL